MTSLKNKIIIVTGSEGDIGKVIVERLRKKGAIVYGFDIKKGIDITDFNDITNLINLIKNKHKRIDILINNAAITVGDWEEIIDTNLTAPATLSKLVSTHMYKYGGSIINITSLW